MVYGTYLNSYYQIGIGNKMFIDSKNPPREFKVGLKKNIKIFDCGSISLDPDEQVTFLTEKKAEYDIVRKKWGFYATPSINGRLKDFGLRTALVRNKFNRYYIMLVEEGFEDDFKSYIKDESNEIVTWLDKPKNCITDNLI